MVETLRDGWYLNIATPLPNIHAYLEVHGKIGDYGTEVELYQGLEPYVQPPEILGTVRTADRPLHIYPSEAF